MFKSVVVYAACCLVLGTGVGAEDRVSVAVAQLDGMAESYMTRSGIPGMAVAVVRGDKILYARGFGVRRMGAPERVDADTVFALASMSKPIGATVVARQVTLGEVKWETPVREGLPWFDLKGAPVTVGDLYAHRSGLPDHAGDTLEELGRDQDTILRKLQQLPLTPVGSKFNYTNYGMTAGATAVASLAQTDWPSLADRNLYKPLGMNSSSSRFADFLARPNRAPGHVKEQGVYVLGPERPKGTGEQRWSPGWNTDPQSPTGGVSSSANDIARWMSFVLGTSRGEGPLPGHISQAAFDPMWQAQTTIVSSADSMYYGYGFFINAPHTGERVYHHSGAFSWGTGTNFSLLPSENVGIVVLTNAWPTGVSEAFSAEFMDWVQLGKSSKDWFGVYSAAIKDAFAPEGELTGKARPLSPVASQALANYVGTYSSPYHGDVRVAEGPSGLELYLGAEMFRLEHWDGDVFRFVPFNDATGPGSTSKADFTGGKLVLEHYNSPKSETVGLGVFTRK